MPPEVLIAIIGSSALFSFIQFIITRIDNKRNNPLNDAVKALLRDRLIHICSGYLRNGEIRVNDLDTVISLYTSYKELGGNGFVTELVDQVTELPKIHN